MGLTGYLSIETEDEVLIDASASAPVDISAAVTAVEVVGEDTAMQIDEEGRPRFAPAKPSVRPPLLGSCTRGKKKLSLKNTNTPAVS